MENDAIKQRLNVFLFSLLGSHELVDRWWTLPNKHWDMRTPDDVLLTDSKSIINYIAAQLNGDYS